MAKLGARVYALDSVKERLDDLVSEVPDICAVHQDLENWGETLKTVEEIGDLDGSVNCAGTVFPSQKIVDVTKENSEKCLDVNLKAAINIMHVVGKKMTATGVKGSTVNISSQVAYLRTPVSCPTAFPRLH